MSATPPYMSVPKDTATIPSMGTWHLGGDSQIVVRCPECGKAGFFVRKDFLVRDAVGYSKQPMACENCVFCRHIALLSWPAKAKP